MDRKATVARTPHGEENVNRLRVPEFGVLAVRLEVGGKSSKCHRPKQSPDPQPEDTGTDDFHFVPEKEVLELKYEVHDPYGTVEEATLELFRRFDDKPLWKLPLKTLGADWWAHGKHTVKWDGRIVEPTAAQKGTAKDGGLEHDLTAITPKKTPKVFPDGYVTLEHTPYKLKLTLGSGTQKIIGSPATGWTYFHLLLKKIEFDLGDEETVPAATVDDARHKMDKAVRKQIDDAGGIPAKDKTRKVVLLSNLYKQTLAEMNDDSFHDDYETEWGDGPNIPVIAKIRMLDSADAEVKLDESDKGAVALGNAKFLWDWEDPDEDVNGVQTAAKPKAFIKDAINYYKGATDTTRPLKDHTYPKGDNCHVDRSGKRGPDADPVFPAQAGYAPKKTLDAGKFPFKVEACKKRVWSAFSTGWTSGELKGKTGVLFQPSRMGGDDYKLSVYLAYDRSDKDTIVLDARVDPLKSPEEVKATTGKFRVWREVHIARYVRKTGTLASFLPGNLASVQTHYEMAYVDVLDKMGGADNNYVLSDHRLADGKTPDYNKLLRARLAGTGNVWFTGDLATDPAADHAAEDSMILARDYDAFVYLAHHNLHGATGDTDLDGLGTHLGSDWSDAATRLGGLNTAGWSGAVQNRLKATKNWLVAQKAQTDAKYAEKLDDLGFGLGEPLANNFKMVAGAKNGKAAGAPPGITTLEFNYTNTVLRDLNAAGRGLGYWYGAAIDPTDADADHCVIMFWKAGVDEFSHEAGHHLFLPHARYPTASPPDGHEDDRHDDTDSGCLMSYTPARPAFCGLCQLRLRGWKAAALKKISAQNKKP